MVNPLDNLLNPSSSDSVSPKSKKDKKKKKLEIKTNPIFKELKPVIIFSVLALILIFILKETVLNKTSNYTYTNITEGMEMTQDNLDIIKSQAGQISGLKSEAQMVQEMINIKQEELQDANLVRTPLEQGFHFIAYLDSLIKKYDIDLVDMYVSATRDEDGKVLDLTQQSNMPSADYSLLPVKIEFNSTYANMTLLFSDFYTKRIVYDEDLTMVNNFDGTVNVKMTIKFDNSPTETIEGTESDSQNPDAQNQNNQGQDTGLPSNTDGVTDPSTPTQSNDTGNPNDINPNMVEGDNSNQPAETAEQQLQQESETAGGVQ